MTTYMVQMCNKDSFKKSIVYWFLREKYEDELYQKRWGGGVSYSSITAHVWRSKDNFLELFLPFNIYIDSGNQT